MSKNKQLKELFIEDLGQVTGGKAPIATTLALGEEGGSTYLGGEEASTMALGEEGDPLPSV